MANSSSSDRNELATLLESDGWFVVPSKVDSQVDLIALDPENGHTLLLKLQSFAGNAYYTSKCKLYREQHVEMCKLQAKFNGHVSVFYALRKKGQSGFRLVHPSVLVKPYLWDAGREPIKPFQGES